MTKQRLFWPWIKPGSKTNELIGNYDGRLKIKIKTPPTEGKTNRALIKFLAEQLDLSESNIVLTKGKQSRHKQVVIYGLQNCLRGC